MVPQTMGFGCLRPSTRKALVITLLSHGGVSHFFSVIIQAMLAGSEPMFWLDDLDSFLVIKFVEA